MGWRELYKPNIVKLIIPVGLLILQIYLVLSRWGHYFLCKVDCGSNIAYAAASILFSLVFIILIVYPIVCWVYALINWILKEIKKTNSP